MIGENVILNAMLSGVGGLIRSLGYDDQYIGGILEKIAKDVTEITSELPSAMQALALEHRQRLERIELKLDMLLLNKGLSDEPSTSLRAIEDRSDRRSGTD